MTDWRCDFPFLHSTPVRWFLGLLDPLLARLILFVWLGLLAAAPHARADRLPQGEIAATWSSRGGPSVGAWFTRPMGRVPLLALDVDASVRLARVGVDPSTPAGGAVVDGVAPSRVGAGIAIAYSWWKPYFVGFVLAALDLGAADAEWIAYGGGRAIVDLDYARIEGAYRVFADSRVSTSYDLAIAVRPWIRWIELRWECHSEDGNADEPHKPCGLGAALHFALPGTPIELRAGGEITFHDWSGTVGAVGERAFMLVTINR